MKYNKKSVEPVLYFIFWLVVGFVICLVGISNVFALENPNASSVQLYDNYGSSLTPITTNIDPGNGVNYTYYGNVGLTANSTGAAVGFQTNDLLVKDHMYSLTIYASADVGLSALSTKNNIGLGTTLSNAVSSYINTNNVEISYSSTSNDYYYYIIKAKITAGYLVVPFNRTSSCSSCFVSFSGYELTDLGNSSDLSQTEVNNIINNQTNVIQNNMAEVEESILANQEKMESSINSNIDDMEQSIVDSNKETQEVIKDQFNTCRDSYNLIDFEFTFTYDDSSPGQIQWNFKRSEFIPVNFGDYYSISMYYNNVLRIGIEYGYVYVYEFDKDYNLINSSNCFISTFDEYYITGQINNEDVKYIRVFYGADNYKVNDFVKVQLQKGKIVTDYEPYGEKICTNKIDDTNNKLDDIQGTITDTSSPDLGALNNTAGWLPTGPVDSILNLPLNMLQSLNIALSKSCTSLNLTIPFVDTAFQIPCISTLYQQIDGFSSLWTWIGSIVSLLMLYTYLLKLYKWVDDTLTFRENNHIDNWGGL